MSDFYYIKNSTSEFDYVERGGICEELTVTITLCEYRELTEQRVRLSAEVERLIAERDKFQKQAEECGKMLIAKHPEVVSKLADAVSEFLDSNPEEETEAADACPLTGCGNEEG